MGKDGKTYNGFVYDEERKLELVTVMDYACYKRKHGIIILMCLKVFQTAAIRWFLELVTSGKNEQWYYTTVINGLQAKQSNLLNLQAIK